MSIFNRYKENIKQIGDLVNSVTESWVSL
jgi:ATP-binding cassette subfamily C (CFTR/MRP) protein 1